VDEAGIERDDHVVEEPRREGLERGGVAAAPGERAVRGDLVAHAGAGGVDVVLRVLADTEHRAPPPGGWFRRSPMDERDAAKSTASSPE
jgi:hypothetical protein